MKNLNYISKENHDVQVLIPQKIPNHQGIIFSDYRRGIHTDLIIRSHFLRLKFCSSCSF